MEQMLNVKTRIPLTSGGAKLMIFDQRKNMKKLFLTLLLGVSAAHLNAQYYSQADMDAVDVAAQEAADAIAGAEEYEAAQAEADMVSQEAADAEFMQAVHYTPDQLLAHYKTYKDVDNDAEYDIVGYDGLTSLGKTNGVERYELALLFGDPEIPRIYKVCNVYLTVKKGQTTLGKIFPRNCE